MVPHPLLSQAIMKMTMMMGNTCMFFLVFLTLFLANIVKSEYTGAGGQENSFHVSFQVLLLAINAIQYIHRLLLCKPRIKPSSICITRPSTRHMKSENLSGLSVAMENMPTQPMPQRKEHSGMMDYMGSLRCDCLYTSICLELTSLRPPSALRDTVERKFACSNFG